MRIRKEFAGLTPEPLKLGLTLQKRVRPNIVYFAGKTGLLRRTIHYPRASLVTTNLGALQLFKL